MGGCERASGHEVAIKYARVDLVCCNKLEQDLVFVVQDVLRVTLSATVSALQDDKVISEARVLQRRCSCVYSCVGGGQCLQLRGGRGGSCYTGDSPVIGQPGMSTLNGYFLEHSRSKDRFR